MVRILGPVCLSDGGHARPGDPSDLIRCRNYVKSHTTVKGYSAQHAHKTQALSVTQMRETRE